MKTIKKMLKKVERCESILSGLLNDMKNYGDIGVNYPDGLLRKLWQSSDRG